MRRLERHPDRLRGHLAELPEPRCGRNRQHAMADIGLAALSVFPMRSPSFPSHQRALAVRQGNSNAQTLFGLRRIPSGDPVRRTLDGAPPTHFNALFTGLVTELDAAGALDGTECFRSRKIHCPNRSTRQRNDGGTEHFRQVLAATLVAAGQGTARLPHAHVRAHALHRKHDPLYSVSKAGDADAAATMLKSMLVPADITRVLRFFQAHASAGSPTLAAVHAHESNLNAPFGLGSDH